jgi:hypothetical protein
LHNFRVGRQIEGKNIEEVIDVDENLAVLSYFMLWKIVIHLIVVIVYFRKTINDFVYLEKNSV